MRRRPPGLGEHADASHKSAWPKRHVLPSCRAISGGISKTLVDNLLSVGIEGKWTKPDEEAYEAILGPSIQWRPTDDTHLDLVAMAGLTHSGPNAECWLIFGFDFGKGSHKAKGYKPTNVAGQ